MQPLFDGVILAEGKTKVIGQSATDPETVVVVSKDDITAGDGAKHDLLSGKAAMATRTTCNNFRLLKACGIPACKRGTSFRASWSSFTSRRTTANGPRTICSATTRS